MLLLGLSAGVFFTFSNSVMPGLRRTDDNTYVTAFTSMDTAILNPLFFVVFVGALVAPGVTAVLTFIAGDVTAAWLFVAATAVYLVGVIGVTGAVNVPLNNALAQNRDRRAFEAPLGAVQPPAIGGVDSRLRPGDHRGAASLTGGTVRRP